MYPSYLVKVHKVTKIYRPVNKYLSFVIYKIISLKSFFNDKGLVLVFVGNLLYFASIIAIFCVSRKTV